MKIESFNENLDFNEKKIVTKVLLETSFSKEIRILLKQGQMMKEHKAPFPIIVHIIDGQIDFGVQGSVYPLKKGDIITLEANIPHDLTALQDSIVRLTLSKLDTSERVEKVISNS
ncbi:quercetin dioxygenase-like cupin family protein [Roseivirga ehrenbergii]|uniref:Cupin n=1 Tax=Roseivirga ehrenbergii (strain DSM 102268 / JCM 13514 / KCTC 12282 / NCIMB 14502 / KMM 6017) TaxID=279360 RepID=A0A150X7R9_ROSEK|nr:cupin domain-containing protein [Roseivirga ehrenbergii]KYG74740.1 cupin [Roseivirga ehrenbergii]TCL13931.1 quercetin dioxygenase-like cupin family protein [Roseivirga ehrenbergii]